MDFWTGSLRIDDDNEIRDVRINTATTKAGLSNDCTLHFLSHVATTRIPLQLICGPPLEVSTTDADTETWFSSLLLSSSSSDAEEDEPQSWWQTAALESPLGILAAVRATAPSSTPQPRTTEVVFYAARKDSQHPPTPPASSSTLEFGLYALPLSSDLLLFNDTDITPPAYPVPDTAEPTNARFLPHPWDGPSLRQKRKSAIESTFQAVQDNRRNLKRQAQSFALSSAAASSVPTLPRLKSESSRGLVPLLARSQSKSPSIASLKRADTTTETRRVSGLSLRATPTPAPPPPPPTEEQEDHQLQEKKNKDAISKVVMAGLRVWGFSASKRKNPLRASSSSSSASTEIKEQEARDEEYKLLYHHVYKAACFALRASIAKEDFSSGVNKGFADAVRETVDSLLEIFCRDPLSDKIGGGGDGGGGGGGGGGAMDVDADVGQGF